MVRVNPEILRWARESAGLDLVEAARKIGLSDARGVQGADRLEAMERGYADPSRPLLLSMAKQYRQPLVAFYLAEPPRAGSRGQDFRTLPVEESEADEAVLNVLLRDVMARQELIRAAIEDEDEPPGLAFIGSASVEINVDQLVARFREALHLPLSEYRACRTVGDSFKLLRGRVEEMGVFVILASNLGSHHTTLDVSRFRGFALADPIAPFIVINDQDSRAAWSFTLLHELAHLWLGYTGVSGGALDHRVERFCNDVASEFLLPSEELREFGPAYWLTLDDLAERVGQFAEERRISRSMVAYRLQRSGMITAEQRNTFTLALRWEWLERQEEARAAKQGNEGGPNYYVTQRHRVGSALLQTTVRLLQSGAITTTKAGRVLGVRPGNIPLLMATPGSTSRAAR
jgi:Zn-dependent peptidase ImmA (M78 family)/transcriptional regulator with XRE-family HTH domain